MKPDIAIFILAGFLLISACRDDGSTSATSNDQKPSDVKRILFLGNSITAGFGLDQSQSFPAIIGRRLEESGQNWEILNAGISGDSSRGGLKRTDRLLRRPIDILVLELGLNDEIARRPAEATGSDLRAIVEKCRSENPGLEVILLAFYLPPPYGIPNYPEMYRRLGAEMECPLIEFPLNHFTRSELQPDGVHPSPEGQRKIAEKVWEEIR